MPPARTRSVPFRCGRAAEDSGLARGADLRVGGGDGTDAAEHSKLTGPDREIEGGDQSRRLVVGGRLL